MYGTLRGLFIGIFVKSVVLTCLWTFLVDITMELQKKEAQLLEHEVLKRLAPPLRGLLCPSLYGEKVQAQRHLWGWLNSIFNRVDKDRVKMAGPDVACAEWLLRCGASVRWKGLDHWEKDYNQLPKGNYDRYKITEIDASDSAVMAIGFPHLEGLTAVKKIKLHNCGYLEDSAIELLPLVKDSLEDLQISSCGDITHRSLPHIKQLQKLKNLVLFDLPEIRDKEGALSELTSALKGCHVDFPDTIEKDAGTQA